MGVSYAKDVEIFVGLSEIRGYRVSFWGEEKGQKTKMGSPAHANSF